MPQHDTTGSKENQPNKQLVVNAAAAPERRDHSSRLYDNRKEGRVAMQGK